MNEITIQQLRRNGSVSRSFTFWKTFEQTPEFLERVERAYHMPRTRVTVVEHVANRR